MMTSRKGIKRRIKGQRTGRKNKKRKRKKTEKKSANKPPRRDKTRAVYALPSNTSLWPGKTFKAVSWFGTPKRIEGKKLEKANEMEALITKKKSCVEVKGRKIRKGRKLFICMPGISPRKKPKKIPRKQKKRSNIYLNSL